MKLLFCVTGLLFLVSALFASPKMDCEPGVVLVGFGPNLTESQIEGISARYGTEVVKVNRSLQYWKLRIPEERSINEMVQILQRHPHILWAEPNGFYYGTQSYCPDDSLLESQWSYKMTQLFSFWRSETGNANVVIGILDTGADSNHPDLAAKLLQGYDFVNNDPNPEDDHGHGTHVSGIAAAITGNDIGIAGVAWDCSILPVKVLNSINQGTWDNIADGIQFAADSGAHVINMSLGDSSATSGGSFAVQNAIAYAYGKNITIIAATANDSGPVSYPAKYPEVIAVGASDTLDNVAGFSNWGPEVDVVAPGVGVLSTTYDGAYNNMSGTSMATPFVSGIAALLITANPDIKPWEVQEWLHEHAVDIDGQPQGGVNNKDGYGRVNFPTVADYCDEYCILHGAGHKNSFFEWMGKEVSGEVYWVDLLDTDGRDNYMGSHDKDGADDAVTYEFPYIPPHINPDGDSVNVLLSVIEHNCSRYSGSADEQLYLSGWFDWEADGNWIGTDDQVINNHTENPATWAQNSKSVNLEITPPDEHIYGNPICTRFRLDYGSGVGIEDSAFWGEVEDDCFINFVEDFDIQNDIFMTVVDYGGTRVWEQITDPDPQTAISHHGNWYFMRVYFSDVGDDCWTGLRSDTFNLEECTACTLMYWYRNESSIDIAVRVSKNGGISWNTVSYATAYQSGVDTVDLSGYGGEPSVMIEFNYHANWSQGYGVWLDDVVLYAYDAIAPATISDLNLTTGIGSRQFGLNWTAPDENNGATSENLGNVYRIKYSTQPITTETEWESAFWITSFDSISSFPIPQNPGSNQSFNFNVPSIFETYYFAIRTQDEVINVSGLSNSPPGSGNTGTTYGIDIDAGPNVSGNPNDTVDVYFTIENTGNIPDHFSVAASIKDTTWEFLLPHYFIYFLPPGVMDTLKLKAIVDAAASPGDTNTIYASGFSLSNTGIDDGDSLFINVPTGINEEHGTNPRFFFLHPLHPNPFRYSTEIEYSIPQNSRVRISIYNIAGQEVIRLVNENQTAGYNTILWDGSNDMGERVAEGIYFIILNAGDITQTRKLIMLE